MPHELAAGAVPRPEAQFLQLGQKIHALPVPALCGPDQGGVEIPPAARPEQGQLIPGKPVYRGAQSGDQGHILPGIVHNLQDGQGHIHLCSAEKVLSPVRRPGDALLVQRPEVVVEHRAGTAQQNHHVGGAQRPQALPLHHHQGLFQQFPDAPGGKTGLQQVFVVPFLLLPLPGKGQIQDVQLQGVGVFAPAYIRFRRL